MPRGIRTPPTALRQAMESAFVLPATESASGALVRRPTKRSILSSTLMMGCSTTLSAYVATFAKSSPCGAAGSVGCRTKIFTSFRITHSTPATGSMPGSGSPRPEPRGRNRTRSREAAKESKAKRPREATSAAIGRAKGHTRRRISQFLLSSRLRDFARVFGFAESKTPATGRRESCPTAT